MKFEFDIEMPCVSVKQTEVVVSCGKSEIKLFQVGSNHRKPRLSGGETGDWLPDYDWRKMYVLEDRLRRDFALPYNAMYYQAMKEVKRREKARLIAEAAKNIDASI